MPAEKFVSADARHVLIENDPLYLMRKDLCHSNAQQT
jgi:hypothetical protein